MTLYNKRRRLAESCVFAERLHWAAPLAMALAVLLTGALEQVAAQSTGSERSDLSRAAERTGVGRLGLSPDALQARDRTFSPGIEGMVDPTTYRIAPGDEMALSIWGSVDLTLPLEVTADGALIVPTVGMVPVGGLTLAEAGEHVRGACATAYPHSTISLSLVRPGLLRISITGQALDPGTYEIVHTFRLADLVEIAGGLRTGADTRHLCVTHADGSQLYCDLLAWQVDGREDGNPVLCGGDRVHVLPAEDTYRVRGVMPEGIEQDLPASSLLDRPFRSETRLIPAREGDHLDFALRASGRLGTHVCADGVWLERTDEGRRWIPLSTADRVALRAGDVVEIPFCREWVAVNGAVVRPGYYPFLPGQTVVDYVSLAGGPSALGRNSGWKIYDPRGNASRAASSDTVAAGARIWVPERRSQTLATVLTPIGSAVALVVSIVALAAK